MNYVNILNNSPEVISPYFQYEKYKFGGLRFFLELAIFFAVKLGTNNPRSCIVFFRMCRDYLEKIVI
jgi:hypothetical protein